MIEFKTINWSEFDERKQKEGGDIRYFSFQDWEVDFLVREVNFLHPAFNEVQILRAILKCCESIPAPYPKQVFYECVLKRLEEA